MNLISGHFNSQPHKEADEFFNVSIDELEHFNSQPHKEADIKNKFSNIMDSAFQLTASQGG